MSETDVTEVAEAVTGITISGPETTTTGGNITAEGWPNTVPATGANEAEALAPTPKALFETGAYLAVPQMDGKATDQIVIAFSGSIKYEASDPVGRALFEKLTLGKEIELRVAGSVAKKAGSWKLAGKEGQEEEVVTGQVGVKVTTLYVLSPEDLT